MMKVNIHWFRRDLRTTDNAALSAATRTDGLFICVFIFDPNILEELPKDDARVSFIHQELSRLKSELWEKGIDLKVLHQKPVDAWNQLKQEYDIGHVFFNRDYEPYALKRDNEISEFLTESGVQVHTLKDHVVFEPGEILKDDGKPYTVFTPFKKKWLARWEEHPPSGYSLGSDFDSVDRPSDFPSLSSLGFNKSEIQVKPYALQVADNYADTRNIPSVDGTSMLGPHLRFGTVSARSLSIQLKNRSEALLNELIWREFFQHIIWHFPHVVSQNFNSKYDGVQWRNNEAEFKAWCEGRTGYPMVDAGMRELNETGHMHNRVRMVVASFLCKHLLIDWRWGEAYFAQKLLDYELASNNGNWQWAASTGCDAAPYFRVFNPTLQTQRFDPDLKYVRKWVPELDSMDYPAPIVEHKSARLRAIEAFKTALNA